LPLVRIDLRKGKNATYREAIGSVVHEPLLGVGVPKDDRFQVFNEHEQSNFIFNSEYLGIRRNADLVIIQITWNEGRTIDQKKALYKAIADCLAARLSLRREVVSNRGQEGELVFRQRRRAIFDVIIHSQMR
jgi:4-oxalocrotonate tautomerase